MIAKKCLLCLLLAACLVLALGACSTKMIKGTKIEDSKESRAVLLTIESYRKAMETRDAETLIRMASPNYFEKNGDANSRNNYDYTGLVTWLRSPEFRAVSALRLTLTYKRVTFNKERNSVSVSYNYKSEYKIPPARFEVKSEAENPDAAKDNFDEEVWHSKNDDNEMVLELVDGKWLIAKGM